MLLNFLLKVMDVISKGYDKGQSDATSWKTTGLKPGQSNSSLEGSKDSPVINPAILVKNWNAEGARVLVNGKAYENSKVGITHQLEGDDLLLYIPIEEEVPVKITILP